MRAESLTPRQWALVAVVLLLALLTTVPAPFVGDQALFAVGGDVLAHGGRYYRDFWDIKQPGVFQFFRAARLLGVGPVGVHLLELIWTIALGVLIAFRIRDHMRTAIGVVAALGLTVGWWAVIAEPGFQTQIESLVGLPLAIVLFASDGLPAVGLARARRRALVIGVAIGVVAVLKLVLVAVAVAIAVPAVLARLRHAEHRGDVLPSMLIAVGGAALVIVPFVVAAIGSGVGDIAFDTTFVLPREVAAAGLNHSLSNFSPWVAGGAHSYGIPSLLALVGVLGLRRRRLDLFDLQLLAWIVVGVLVMLPQRWSGYQWQLLGVPLGLLAARTVDRWWQLRRTGSLRAAGVTTIAMVLALVVGLAINAQDPARRVAVLADNGFGLGDSAEAYRRDLSREYAAVAAELDRVGDVPDGSLYVMGDPLVYVQLGRTQALPQNGWSVEQWLDDQWHRFVQQLDEHRPEVLFVAYYFDTYLDERPEAVQLLDKRYEEFSRSPQDAYQGGRWLQLRPDDSRSG